MKLLVIKSPADVLEKAARELENHGWTQRNFAVGEKKCLVGAINYVTSGTPYSTLGADMLSLSDEEINTRRILRNEALEHLMLEIKSSPTTWNDSRGRTQRQVVEFLRKVAKKCRANA